MGSEFSSEQAPVGSSGQTHDYKGWIKDAYDQTAEARMEQRWSSIADAAESVSEDLLRLASIKAGHRVLDLGCGVGEPTLSAASKVGPTGRVVAIDISSRSLAVARARAIARGFGWVEFKELDLDQAHLPAQYFNAVLSRWSLMLVQRLAATLGAIRETLLPGGKCAIAIIGTPDRNSVSRTVALIRKWVGAPTRPLSAPDPFSLCNPNYARKLFQDAGFDSITHEEREVVAYLTSAKDYVDWCTTTQAPVRGLIAALPTPMVTAVMQRIEDFAAREMNEERGIAVRLHSIQIGGTANGAR